MDVKTAIQSRRSIRKYENKPIPKEILEDLLESARIAPSANNAQGWYMIAITDKDILAKLVPMSGHQKFVEECSLYLVGVTEPGVYYSAVDMTIALDHLSLRALELGLGSCWIGDFESDKLKQLLGIPAERDVPICMTVGFPAQSPAARKRKPLSQLFHKEKWGTPWS
jgi:nitroreductase